MMRAAMALAALIAVAGAVGWRSYARDLARANERIATGSQLATTPCGTIEYARAGSGVPLLLIHGSGGGFDQSLGFGRRLLGAGVEIVAPSRFGYLRTPAPADASAEAQADAHACLLDALGMERVAVLGASAGASSAMQLCIRHPQRCSALVLLVPAAYSPTFIRQANNPNPALKFVVEHVLTTDPVFWCISRLAPGLLVRTMLATPEQVFENAAPAERARALTVIDGVEPVSRRAVGLDIDATITSTQPRYALERIVAPTLLISVEDDLYGTYESARYTAAQIPGAKLSSYPTGGHIWLGHDEDVWREIASFVGGHP